MSLVKKQTLLKCLPQEIRSIVRSGIAITSVSQCVEELVYNAIDANAKNIHIGVNLDNFNVRVEDDGTGLTENDLESAGKRYTTSKCHRLEDLTNLKYYGFRGEALSSIIEVSGTVDIISRPKEIVGIELRKKYENGHVIGFIEKHNTANVKSGTTIVVGKLLSKLPVRQKRIDKGIQLEEVKNSVEKVSLINPSLNIELRNEKTGAKIFDYKSSSSYSEAFHQLFNSRIGFEANFTEEHFLYKKLFFNISISSDYCKKKHYQFVFVNNRFIQRCRLHKWVESNVLETCRGNSASPKSEKFQIFILNITCPFSEYDVTLDPRKHRIEFKDWDVPKDGIEGLIAKLKTKHPVFNVPTGVGVSALEKDNSATTFEVKGAVHSRFAVRKQENDFDTQSAGINSELGSVGRRNASVLSNEKKPMSPKRKLTRTGNSSHIVDVRAIRRKRKVNNNSIIVKKGVVQKQEPTAKVARLTSGVFNRFTEWKGELTSSEINISDKVSLLPDKGNAKNQSKVIPFVNLCENDEKMIIDSSSNLSTLQWKINRFLKNDETNKNEDSSASMILSRPSNQCGKISNCSNISTSNRCKSSILSAEDAQATLLNECEKYLKDLIQHKWKISDERTAIVNNIMKYYKKEIKQSPETNLTLFKIMQPNETHIVSTKDKTEVHIKKMPVDAAKASISDKNSVQLKPQILQPATLQILKLTHSHGSGRDVSNVTEHVPPLLNVLPIQKSFSSDWNDKMMTSDYFELDDELFPSDWTAEVVLDSNEQEWLKTVDTKGKNIYINLTTGQSSYDMINVFGSLRKVTAREIKKSYPAGYNWLKAYFPSSFKQFWNGNTRDVSREGDFSKMAQSIIGTAVQSCIDENKNEISKWKDNELANSSQYFKRNESTRPQPTTTDIKGLKKLDGVTTAFRFNRDDMKHVRVINQFDKKFILASLRKSMSDKETLVIFDQHAVHERIRLEKFVTESFVNSKAPKKSLIYLEVMPPYPLHLSENEVRIMQTYVEFFEQIGVKFQLISSTSVKIKTAPKCICERIATEPLATREGFLKNLIHNLIREQIHHIMDTKGTSMTGIPKTVFNVLCSQACHGAIKFGDELDYDTCCQLISDLKQCKTLFQCAHGRPSIVPLINLGSIEGIEPNTVSFTCHASSPNANSRCWCSIDGNNTECSSYFCKPLETSSEYFSYAENPSKSAVGGPFLNQTGLSFNDLANRVNLPFSINVKCGVPQSLFTDKNSDNLAEDEEDSPYFFDIKM